MKPKAQNYISKTRNQKLKSRTKNEKNQNIKTDD